MHNAEMKKFFLAVILSFCLIPQLTLAATVEEQYQSILKQFIAILEIRLGQLQFAEAPTGLLSGSTFTSSSTNPRRLTSGGGRRVIVTPPPVVVPAVAITGRGNNFSIVTKEVVSPKSVQIAIKEVLSEIVFPSTISLTAYLKDGDYLTVDLIANSDLTKFTANLEGLLNLDQEFSGDFSIIWPEEISSQYVAYRASYEGNSVILTASLVNSGTPDVYLYVSDQNTNSGELMVEREINTSAVQVLAFGLESGGGGRTSLQGITIDFLSSPEVLASEVVEAARLVIGENTYLGEVGTTTLNFSNMNMSLVKGEPGTFFLELDILPQLGNYNFNQTISFVVEPYNIKAFLEGEVEAIENIDGQTIEGAEQNLVPRSVFVPPGSFSSSQSGTDTTETVGEFTIEFAVEALFSDFYLTDEAVLSSENPNTGIGFSVLGDYGTGTVSAVLTSNTATKDSPGIFTIKGGETQLFTLTVTLTTNQADSFKISLDELWPALNSDGETDPRVYYFDPAVEFITPALAIEAS